MGIKINENEHLNSFFEAMCLILFCIAVGHAVWGFKTCSSPAAVEEECVLKNDIGSLGTWKHFSVGRAL